MKPAIAEQETLENVCNRLGLTASVKYGNSEARAGNLDEWKQKATPWTIKLSFQGRTMSTPYWTGSAISEEPTEVDAINSLLMDAESGEECFEDFCANCGYSTDSIKALNLWESCRETEFKLRKFLGGHLSTFQQAERL